VAEAHDDEAKGEADDGEGEELDDLERAPAWVATTTCETTTVVAVTSATTSPWAAGIVRAARTRGRMANETATSSATKTTAAAT
jgi:hypothetical protein